MQGAASLAEGLGLPTVCPGPHSELSGVLKMGKVPHVGHQIWQDESLYL